MSLQTTKPATDPASAALSRMALSAEEVAEVLGISRSHVFRLESSGRLPRSVRLGRAVRWNRATLEAWLTAGAPTRDRWEAMQAESARDGKGRR